MHRAIPEITGERKLDCILLLINDRASTGQSQVNSPHSETQADIHASIDPEDLQIDKAILDQTVPERFEQVVSRIPDQIALTGNGQEWSYLALNQRTNQIAHAISQKGKSRAGRVAILVDQSPEMVIAILAALKAGKIYCGVHPGTPDAAQAEILKDAAPELILTTASLADRARETRDDSCPVLLLEEIEHSFPGEIPPNYIQPDDPLAIFYTSGTTGHSKGVVKSHRMVMHRVWLSTRYDQIMPADRQSLLTHCAFASSEADIFCALLQGATVCVFDVRSRGLPALREWIDGDKITLFHPPVLLFRSLLETLKGPGQFPSVRLVALAGDVVVPEDLQGWRRHFSDDCILLHRFSTTETALLTVARYDRDSILDPHFVSGGRPVPDKVLTLVDENERPVAPGETGELLVRSRYLANGYWQQPEASMKAFKSAAEDSDIRTYCTGDRGRFLSDGSFMFIGRRQHLAKIRGYRVDAHEIEETLLQFEEISAAAVLVKAVDQVDQLWAFVEMKNGVPFDKRNLRRTLAERLPEWKVPSLIELVAKMPRTLTGKVDRQALARAADQVQMKHSSDAADPSSDSGIGEIETVLRDIWKEMLGLKEVSLDDSFFDLGANSIFVMRILNRIEEQYGIRLHQSTLFENTTIRDLAALLRDMLL